MLIGGLSKLTTFLNANGAVDLRTNAPIPAMHTCGVDQHYLLNDGRVVEVVEAWAGGYAKNYGFTCTRFEVREVAA